MSRGTDGPGIREALWGWAIWGLVAATVFVTYARLPASDFYNVTGTGVWSGAARLLVLTGWPISLAALALMAVAADRLLAGRLEPGTRRAVIAAAIVTSILCATVAVPGVIKQSDLDARPVNLLAGSGVLAALGLTLYTWRRTGTGPPAERTRGDRIALWVAAVYTLLALPWIFANLGFYVGDVPGLHAVFMSKKVLPEAGHPHLRAVHLGNHEGLDGWLLAVTALLLRPGLKRMRQTRLRPVLGGYLALLLCYGVMVSANDGWNEQLGKRGWTSHNIPSVLSPALNYGTGILIVAAVVVYLVAFRVRTRVEEPVLA
ncbi:MAG TPA: hypothetical protein VHS27_01225 [Gaiellales bacterium]|jgi:hypothetical protein|nr:hypothetical protein [Gaiellales bacterium]